MARGGTTKRINPAHLHATQGGELEMYTHDIDAALTSWAREAWVKGHASDDDIQLALAGIYNMLMQTREVPAALREASVNRALDQLRHVRGAAPRELRPQLREHYRSMADYAAQVGWTLPAQMDLSVQAQLSRQAMQVDNEHVIALARMRAATSLVAALEGADEGDVAELELLRAHGLASADEAWTRCRIMQPVEVGALDLGRLYLACVQSRAARIRARRIAPEVAQLKSIAREHGWPASVAVITVPKESWIAALGIEDRPYVVKDGQVVIVGPHAYRDLKSTDAREQLRARSAVLALLMGQDIEATTREAAIIANAWASHKASHALLEAGLSEQRDTGSWQDARRVLGERLDTDLEDLLEQWQSSGAHAGRTWHAAMGHLAAWT